MPAGSEIAGRICMVLGCSGPLHWQAVITDTIAWITNACMETIAGERVTVFGHHAQVVTEVTQKL
jgi:hypothetical protein